MRGIRKRFGATEALADVDFDVEAGEVHALIGENGAGKSTLMRILSGALAADEGLIELDGRRFLPQDPLQARRRGVVMIYQELNLAAHLSVAENIVLGAESSRLGWLDRKRDRARALEVLQELKCEDLPVDRPAYRLSVAEKQVVEIARALLYDARILIMDEPTSSLTRSDVDGLFAAIRRLRERGVSVVYISHFLEECREIAESFTVLRDGRTVASGAMSEVDERDLVRMMVGRDIEEIYPIRDSSPGEPVLETRALKGKGKPESVTLSLRRGEILGVAGLVGAGRTETLRVLFGLDEAAGGSVFVFGRDSARRHPPERLREGIGFLSENRKDEGLMAGRSLADNLTLSHLRPLSRFGFLHVAAQQAVARDWIDRLDVRASGPRQNIDRLSGGNQQKVAFGRLLFHDAKIFLLDEPTRGIDVGSKVQLYGIMSDLAAAGKSVIFVSSYLPELLGLCDTIAVMYRGRIMAARPAGSWTEEELLAAALGQEE